MKYCCILHGRVCVMTEPHHKKCLTKSNEIILCMLVFCRLLSFFKINFLKKVLVGVPSKCETVWIQIRPDIIKVGPDLGPNFEKALSADDTGREGAAEDKGHLGAAGIVSICRLICALLW